jgi:hypothetical protein
MRRKAEFGSALFSLRSWTPNAWTLSPIGEVRREVGGAILLTAGDFGTGTRVGVIMKAHGHPVRVLLDWTRRRAHAEM